MLVVGGDVGALPPLLPGGVLVVTVGIGVVVIVDVGAAVEGVGAGVGAVVEGVGVRTVQFEL